MNQAEKSGHSAHKNHEHKHASDKDALSADDSAKNEKKKSSSLIAIIIMVIIIVLIASLIIYLPDLIKSRSSNDKQYLDGTNVAIYNYYTFNRQEDSKWYLELSIKQTPYIIPFYYNPFQTENVSIDQETMPTLSRFMNYSGPKIVYVSIDPLASSKIAIAAFEVKRILDTNYGIFNFQAGYGIHYLHEANYTEYPVATCANARSDRIIIMLNVTGGNSITTRNNCILINAVNSDELIRVADAFDYRILGIVRDSTVSRT